MDSASVCLIRAGRAEDLPPAPAEWAFVDVGFSQKRASCGLLLGNGEATTHRFGDLQRILVAAALSEAEPLNLVFEAPLSVAFASNGNPTGRSVEKRGKQHRYWHSGLGTTVLLSAMHLLRSVAEARPRREIRLFEGFVSFKTAGRSDHCADVRQLRDVVFGCLSSGRIIWPPQLKLNSSDDLVSAFAVAGMNLGVPPVILVGN